MTTLQRRDRHRSRRPLPARSPGPVDLSSWEINRLLELSISGIKSCNAFVDCPVVSEHFEVTRRPPRKGARMKKMFIGLMLLTMLAVSCAPQIATEPPTVIVEKADTTGEPAEPGEPLSSVEQAAVDQLARNLGIDPDGISVLDNHEIEFNDACMGVVMEDVMCAQVITPGHIIILEVNGIQYEYHTDENGSRVQPATFALTWRREGGIAGFCDSLTVFLSGEVYGNRCKIADGRTGTFASLLTDNELTRFSAWIQEYGQVTLDSSDPKGVADGMTLVIEFFGNGKGKPGEPVEREIFAWVQDLFQELYD